MTYDRRKKASGSSEKVAALQALDKFVDSAGALSRAWEQLSDDSFLMNGYPKGLPSFDEFHHELLDWLHSAKR